RKQLQSVIGNGIADITSTASSSSVTLPSQTDPSSRSPSPLQELGMDGPVDNEATSADEHHDCDCDCKP
ncbi:hypothetical protein BGX30_014379, partial [Mortierella sp. GBA39]